MKISKIPNFLKFWIIRKPENQKIWKLWGYEDSDKYKDFRNSKDTRDSRNSIDSEDSGGFQGSEHSKNW